MLGFVARVGQRRFQVLALGDIAADALNFHELAFRIADGIVLPSDPAKASDGFEVLIVGDALSSGFAPRETPEYGKLRVGMGFGMKRLPDDIGRLQTEEFEEALIGIGHAP